MLTFPSCSVFIRSFIEYVNFYSETFTTDDAVTWNLPLLSGWNGVKFNDRDKVIPCIFIGSRYQYANALSSSNQTEPGHFKTLNVKGRSILTSFYWTTQAWLPLSFTTILSGGDWDWRPFKRGISKHLLKDLKVWKWGTNIWLLLSS